MPFARYTPFRGKLGLGKISLQSLAGVGIIVVAIIAIAIYGFTRSATSASFSFENSARSDNSMLIEQDTEDDIVVVHVAGCVNAPGVYSLSPGSRIVDAIDAAGGFTDDASRDILNLASPVSDGMKILVASSQTTQENVWEVQTNLLTMQEGNEAGYLVNINTATSSQLEALPGIGETMASRIVSYRDMHGLFAKTEDLMNVSGIGEKKYAALKDFIIV